jgi:predicted O-linked N-acetylglucosamine transferase (SPINDLY family)
MLNATSPLAMLGLTDDSVQQLLTAHAYVGRTWGFDMEHLCAGRKYAHSRIRIGFVSGDLCTHTVGVLLPEFLEAIDKNQFELYAYDYSVEDGKTLRARLKAVFDHFMSVKGISDRAVAEAAPIQCSFTRADCGLPEDAFVMVSFRNIYKFNPGLFKLWMSLLKAIDHAVLWVVDNNPTTTGNLLHWAQSQGVDPSRIVFRKRSVFSEYQQKLFLADVFLDTFP